MYQPSESHRIAILGDEGAGKHSLCRRLLYDIFEDEILPLNRTMRYVVSISRIIPGRGKRWKQVLELDLYNKREIASENSLPMPETETTPPTLAHPHSDAAIIVVNLAVQKSIESLTNWVSYARLELTSDPTDFPILILATSSDLVPEPGNQITRLAASLCCACTFVSSKTGDGVQDAFKRLIFTLEPERRLASHSVDAISHQPARNRTDSDENSFEFQEDGPSNMNNTEAQDQMRRKPRRDTTPDRPLFRPTMSPTTPHPLLIEGNESLESTSHATTGINASATPTTTATESPRSEHDTSSSADSPRFLDSERSKSEKRSARRANKGDGTQNERKEDDPLASPRSRGDQSPSHSGSANPARLSKNVARHQLLGRTDGTSSSIGPTRVPTKIDFLKKALVHGKKRVLIISSQQLFIYKASSEEKTLIDILDLVSATTTRPNSAKPKLVLHLASGVERLLTFMDEGGLVLFKGIVQGQSKAKRSTKRQAVALMPRSPSAPYVSGDQALALFRAHVSNHYCAECGIAQPTYVSTNLAVVICNECAQAHRELPHRLSRVVSITQRNWNPYLLNMLLALPNEVSNSIWEEVLLAGEVDFGAKDLPEKPFDISDAYHKATFIQYKYFHRAYLHPDFLASMLNINDTVPLRALNIAAKLAALRFDHLSTLLKFIAHGFCPNSIIDSQSLLSIACVNGNYNATILLLENGANPNAPDSALTVPLDYTTEFNSQSASLLEKEALLPITYLLVDGEDDTVTPAKEWPPATSILFDYGAVLREQHAGVADTAKLRLVRSTSQKEGPSDKAARLLGLANTTSSPSSAEGSSPLRQSIGPASKSSKNQTLVGGTLGRKHVPDSYHRKAKLRQSMMGVPDAADTSNPSSPKSGSQSPRAKSKSILKGEALTPHSQLATESPQSSPRSASSDSSSNHLIQSHYTPSDAKGPGSPEAPKRAPSSAWFSPILPSNRADRQENLLLRPITSSTNPPQESQPVDSAPHSASYTPSETSLDTNTDSLIRLTLDDDSETQDTDRSTDAL